MGASVPGVSHERAGTPCQDAHLWRAAGSNSLILAVADGAGSASHSEEGAQLAVGVAVESVAAAFAGGEPESAETRRDLLFHAATEARGAIEEYSLAGDIELRELACTLILAVASPGRICALQIGDGAAVARLESGAVVAVTTPCNGEYLNETVFLTGAAAIESAQYIELQEEIAGIAVFSDGLQTIALTSKDVLPHAPFFEPLFRFVSSVEDPADAANQLEAFLRSPRFQQRTDDDLTLLIAVTPPGSR